MRYFDELTSAMTMLAQDQRTLFVGQSVAYDGQRAHFSFAGVPEERRMEMPICEDFTVGFCAGLSLEGYVPVCFIPRWDFLILAANQILNHLDKMPLMGWAPKVLIRTAVGTNKPLDPGPQHTQDYSEAFRLMLKTIPVFEFRQASEIVPRYKQALAMQGSAILVERMEHY